MRQPSDLWLLDLRLELEPCIRTTSHTPLSAHFSYSGPDVHCRFEEAPSSPSSMVTTASQKFTHTTCLQFTLPGHCQEQWVSTLSRKINWPGRTRDQMDVAIRSSSQRAYSCSEMANDCAPAPFTARKTKTSSDGAFGVWKGPHCD